MLKIQTTTFKPTKIYTIGKQVFIPVDGSSGESALLDQAGKPEMHIKGTSHLPFDLEALRSLFKKLGKDLPDEDLQELLEGRGLLIDGENWILGEGSVEVIIN